MSKGVSSERQGHLHPCHSAPVCGLPSHPIPMNHDFSRRRFLKGLGTLIALPAMESLAPGRAVAAAAKSGLKSQHPLRMAFIYSPNGRNMTHWTPEKVGAD